MCEFEEKHKEVEVERIEWIVEKFSMEGNAGCAKTMNVKIKISLKQ